MNIIEQAAKNLPGHWHQGYYVGSQKENMCGIGHVMNAAAHDIMKESPLLLVNDPIIQSAVEVMGKVAEEQYPDRMHDLEEDPGADRFVAFNDHKDTTEEEVVAVMEKAAIKFDEQV